MDDTDFIEGSGNVSLVAGNRTIYVNFAIVLDVYPMPERNPDGVAQALNVISYIGVIVSIVCLLLLILTYLSSENLRSSQEKKLHINLSIGLVGTYIMFIVCQNSTSNVTVCAVMGGLLHYFLLVSFIFMAAEGIWHIFSISFPLAHRRYTKSGKCNLTSMILAWIVPLAVVVVSEAPDFTNYIGEEFCRPYGPPFYGGVLVPFAIIYIFNWFSFIAVIIQLNKFRITRNRRRRHTVGKNNIRRIALLELSRNALYLFFLYGLGWGVGLVATTSIPNVPVSVIFQVIFIVLAAYQGLGMLFTQLIVSDHVREEWYRWAKLVKNVVTGEVNPFECFEDPYRNLSLWCMLTSVCHPGRKVITFTASAAKSGQYSYLHEGNSSDFETLSSCDSFSDACPEASTVI